MVREYNKTNFNFQLLAITITENSLRITIIKIVLFLIRYYIEIYRTHVTTKVFRL